MGAAKPGSGLSAFDNIIESYKRRGLISFIIGCIKGGSNDYRPRRKRILPDTLTLNAIHEKNMFDKG